VSLDGLGLGLLSLLFVEEEPPASGLEVEVEGVAVFVSDVLSVEG
jgi:hypothetical protein